jgi:large subunit ribosomal protein L34
MTTLGGTKRKAVRVSGFRARLKTKSGRNILSKRRRKGRKMLTIKRK